MMESTVNTGMCRCCASEGAFKDIQSTYHWMGEEEVYADMLRECFDIILNVSEQGDDGGICEVCITQLRNAINFKKQVLHTEDQFKKHLQNKTLFRPNIVKVEMTGDEDSDDNMGSGDDGFSGNEFEVPIKTEVDDPKPKKRAAAKASATTTRASAKKAKADNGETSTKRDQEKVLKESVDAAVLVIVEPEKKPISKAAGIELKKHRHNAREILLYTNATPIMRRGGVGYMCSYCLEEFPEPMDLKTHTLTDHPTEFDPTVGISNKSAPMSEYNIKLDITDLECRECSTQLDSVEETLNHLQVVHNRDIHTDIKSHILPFKFETEVLTCCLCKKTFDKFKKMQEHMHAHFRNFICSVCDAGFITQGCLTRHQISHTKGVFPCSYCPRVYTTSVKKRAHERCNHTHNNSINRCGYCNKGFRDYHRKEQHVSEVHGVKPTVYQCNACDNIYISKRRLRIHVKRDHLLERTNKCPTCGMSFFSSHDVKKHMITHTGIREFKCDICLKSFGRKSTLNNHMRIHNDDRRFKCELCGRSFVQKCSWKGHMKTKHGKIVK